uniref:EF-hand domain-containing protein n=1 Tax=Lotharella globosa TaxID=91324 RepID=A0A7S4DSX4_9EUKA
MAFVQMNINFEPHEQRILSPTLQVYCHWIGDQMGACNCREDAGRGRPMNINFEPHEQRILSPTLQVYKLLDRIAQYEEKLGAETFNDKGIEVVRLLWKEALEDPSPSNLTFSPPSFMACIIMLQLATIGGSRNQLQKAFGREIHYAPRPEEEEKHADDEDIEKKAPGFEREITVEEDSKGNHLRDPKKTAKTPSTEFWHSVWIHGQVDPFVATRIYQYLGGSMGNRLDRSFTLGAIEANGHAEKAYAELFETLDKNKDAEITEKEFIAKCMAQFDGVPDDKFEQFVNKLYEKANSITVESGVPKELLECVGKDRDEMLKVIFNAAKGEQEDSEISAQTLSKVLEDEIYQSKKLILGDAFSQICEVLKELAEGSVTCEFQLFSEAIGITFELDGEGANCSDEDFLQICSVLMSAARTAAKIEAGDVMTLKDAKTREQKLQVVFDALDDDHSGALTKKEFIDQMGVPPPRDLEPIDWWVQQVTRDKIRHVYGTRLIGTSCVGVCLALCKPIWKTKFTTGVDPEHAKQGKFLPDLNWFQISEDHKIRCEFMHYRWVKTAYLPMKKFILIYLPIGNGQDEGAIVAIRRQRKERKAYDTEAEFDWSPPTLDEILTRTKFDERTGNTVTKKIKFKDLKKKLIDPRRFSHRSCLCGFFFFGLFCRKR